MGIYRTVFFLRRAFSKSNCTRVRVRSLLRSEEDIYFSSSFAVFLELSRLLVKDVGELSPCCLLSSNLVAIMLCSVSRTISLSDVESGFQAIPLLLESAGLIPWCV
jgi:hypothetical protein